MTAGLSLVLIVVALAWIFGVLLWLTAGRASRGGQPRRRQRFLAALEGALDLGEREGTSFEGRLDPDDRVAKVTIVKGDPPIVRFQVEVLSNARMRLSRETAAVRFKKAALGIDEVQTGDKAFDDAIFIETANEKRARHHLARGPELRKRIIEAFEKFGITSLEVRDGFLEARAPLAALRGVKDYPRLLALLAQTARAFDRVGLKVTVLGGERVALAGTEGNARCAYCHTDVTGEEPDLVACEKCHTVLHAECYDELGKCPILGCTGAMPERGRARA